MMTWTDNGSPNGDTGGWHHYAYTWSSGSNAVVYYDGSSIATTNLGVQYLSITNDYNWLAIGTLNHDGTPQLGDDSYPNAGWFNGVMSDLRIYSRALTGTEINNIYTGNETGGSSGGLVGTANVQTLHVGTLTTIH